MPYTTLAIGPRFRAMRSASAFFCRRPRCARMSAAMPAFAACQASDAAGAAPASAAASAAAAAAPSLAAFGSPVAAIGVASARLADPRRVERRSYSAPVTAGDAGQQPPVASYLHRGLQHSNHGSFAAGETEIEPDIEPKFGREEPVLEPQGDREQTTETFI